MVEKIDFTNRNISPEELAKCKELARKLRSAAPADAVVERMAKSLELGYADAAKEYYESNLDKFTRVPAEAKKIIIEELVSNK